MKATGIVCLVIALSGFAFAIFMNVSIDTRYGNFNNIGLMADRQNIIIISGLLAVIAVLLIGFGTLSERGIQHNLALETKCPFCAEIIMTEAVVCKHCGNKLSPQEQRVTNQSTSIYEETLLPEDASFEGGKYSKLGLNILLFLPFCMVLFLGIWAWAQK